MYTNPDVLYQFPLSYGNAPDSSLASYTSSIPGLYYRETVIARKNTVTGWGSITTPYGTFGNCLKLVSEVMQIDSLSVDTISFPKDTSYYREYKWLDPAEKYPLLYIRQNKIGNGYVTQLIEYLDSQQYFQPHALFGFYPLTPVAGDTVLFQNLSTNAVSYDWNFADPAGASNTSTAINPSHVFTHPGTYPVSLIAYNGILRDTFSLNVIVDSLNTVSLQTALAAPLLRAFPNPVSSLVTITTSTEAAAYLVYNTSGNLAAKGRKEEGPSCCVIDLSGQQAGVYYIQIINARGRSIEKIILTN